LLKLKLTVGVIKSVLAVTLRAALLRKGAIDAMTWCPTRPRDDNISHLFHSRLIRTHPGFADPVIVAAGDAAFPNVRVPFFKVAFVQN
jgi:hypothetical protein